MLVRIFGCTLNYFTILHSCLLYIEHNLGNMIYNANFSVEQDELNIWPPSGNPSLIAFHAPLNTRRPNLDMQAKSHIQTPSNTT